MERKLSITAYHMFKYRGQHFLFDIPSNSFIKCSDAAFRFFELLEQNTITDSDALHKLSLQYDNIKIDVLKNEINSLRESGYLPKNAHTYSDEENEKLISSLVKKNTNKIELYLAEACNLRCKYCYVANNGAIENGLMPLNIAFAAVDLLFKRISKNNKGISITFFGGEPLLNKPVMKAVIAYSQEKLKDTGRQEAFYSLTTNGTLLDDEVINYIKKYNFGLMISMDGPPDIHNSMRPFADGSGSFSTVEMNVKRLMKRRKMVTVRCTLSNKYIDIDKLIDFFDNFGFTRIGFAACSGKSYMKGQYDITDEQIEYFKNYWEGYLDRYLAQIKIGKRRKFDPYSSIIRSIHNHETFRIRCGVCRGCTTVGIDGMLYPCHRYVGMKKFIVGDVWNGINDEKHAQYLKGYFSTKKKCENCWAIHICGGVCPWYVSHEDGFFIPPSDAYCESIRQGLERDAWLAYEVAERFPDEYAKIVGIKEDDGEAIADRDSHNQFYA